MRIEAIDPREHPEAASRVLRSAWSPPCLRYAPEDLRWAFGRPGGVPARAYAAFDGPGEMVGLCAILGRRVRFRGAEHDAYLASFLAAAPGPRRGLVAAAVLRAEARQVRSAGLPLLTFAEPGSAGEAMLRGFEAAGLFRRSLGHYHVHVGLPRGPADAAAAREASASDFGAVAELAARCDDGRTIRAVVDPAALEHERADPRGRCLALVEDASGRPIAAAVAYRSQMIGPRGPEASAALGPHWLPGPGPGALRALIRFASGRWEGSREAPVVVVPNCAGLDPADVRAAGLRMTAGAWAGFLFAPGPDHPLLGAEATDLEIV